MFIPITRILLCLALCLVLFSILGCPPNSCLENQDVSDVYIMKNGDNHIDSVVLIANDSIIGCGSLTRKAIGSKTHHVRFPINVRLQLFSQGNLLKELFFKMDKNTTTSVYAGTNCSDGFIDSSSTDNYCWSIRKMEDTSSNEDLRCTGWVIGGDKQEFCDTWFLR
jgi:hypothetical protein